MKTRSIRIPEELGKRLGLMAHDLEEHITDSAQRAIGKEIEAWKQEKISEKEAARVK